MEKVGRNEPCPCGSGKKYKNCHMKLDDGSKIGKKTILYIILFIVLLGLGATGAYLNSQKGDMPPVNEKGQVWSIEHQHYH